MGEDGRGRSWRLPFSKERVSFSGDRGDSDYKVHEKRKERPYSYQESIRGLEAVILCIL